jgi:hypothetical protein
LVTWTRRMSAPASARAMAMDWPMPRVPPVTRAVWPDSEKSCWTVVMVVMSLEKVFGMNARVRVAVSGVALGVNTGLKHRRMDLSVS